MIFSLFAFEPFLNDRLIGLYPNDHVSAEESLGGVKQYLPRPSQVQGFVDHQVPVMLSKMGEIGGDLVKDLESRFFLEGNPIPDVPCKIRVLRVDDLLDSVDIIVLNRQAFG